MRKNVSSQVVSFQGIATADGSPVTTGTPTVYYTVDGGTQGTGAGTSTHEGQGQWSYVPVQAETNGNHVAYTFVLTNAINQTVNVWPVSFNPTDSVRLGMTALPNAAADAAGGLSISDLGGLDLDAMAFALALITGFDGVTLATLQGNYAPSKAGDDMGLSATATSAQLVDDIWDEVLSKAAHNIAQSSGKLLRQLAATVVRQDTAQGPGIGNNQIQFDTGASATDGAYDPSIIVIVDGLGAGQSRLILQYNGATKTATVDRNWKTNPDNTSEFLIISDAGREHVNEGLAQGGTSTSITLNALASSDDGAYIGQTVFIRSGTGEDQAGLVNAYNGTTKAATIAEAWAVTPDSTSAYVMLPTSLHDDAKIDAILEDTGTTLPDQINTLNDVSVSDVLTTQMTEAYAADGTAPTLAQAIFLIQQTIGDFSIAGTTLTAKRLDGTSTAATYTLDDAANPTSRTRST